VVKVADKKSAREKLSDVHPDFHFRVKDGSTVKSLHELEAKLKDMDDETFVHHVSDEKNDFKNWIEAIINDDKLAAKLAKHKTKKDIIKVVELRVRQLERARNVEDMISSAKQRIEKRKERKDAEAGVTKTHLSPLHEKSTGREHLIHNLKDFTEGVIIGVLIGIIIGKVFVS
jgi:hypothetical protein